MKSGKVVFGFLHIKLHFKSADVQKKLQVKKITHLSCFFLEISKYFAMFLILWLLIPTVIM